MTIQFIAALSAPIQSADTALKLLPAGEFRARDGRPAECAAWRVDADIAAQLVNAAAARVVPYVIDYEHQTLNAAQNGQPAPAAAWFKTLEWREGDGLYAVDVDYTARASAMIEAHEYRYLSPVFTYDRDGNVSALLHVALTNTPALDCLDEVKLAAASVMAGATITAAVAALSTGTPIEEPGMDELLEQLRWLLNLPVGSTADDVKVQLQKLIDALSDGKGTAATSVSVPALLAAQRDQIAALTAKQADPAKFVPINVMTALRTELDAANAKLAGTEVGELVSAALSDGRLLSAQESWARELGNSNLAALKTFLTTAKPIAALTSTQTQGHAPGGAKSDTKTADASGLAICKALGISPDDYAKSALAAESPAA